MQRKSSRQGFSSFVCAFQKQTGPKSHLGNLEPNVSAADRPDGGIAAGFPPVPDQNTDLRKRLVKLMSVADFYHEGFKGAVRTFPLA